MSHPATVAVVGQGSVGRALAHTLSFYHPTARHDICGPHDWSGVLSSRVAFVCVGTPAAADGHLDVSQVDAALAELARHHYAGVVVVKSTLDVGTMAIMRSRYPALRLVYSPEFLRERSAFLWTVNLDRLVLAGAPADCAIVEETMRWLEDVPVLYMNDREAEIAKLAHNAFIAVKVEFANEIGDIARAHGVDADVIMSVIHADRRVGSPEHLRPSGEAFGGKCVPKDTRALATAAPDAAVIEAALAQNQRRARQDNLDEGVAVLTDPIRS